MSSDAAEAMSKPFRDKVLDALIAEAGLVHFQREPWVNPITDRVEHRVLGTPVRMQWRLGQDSWDRIVAPILRDDPRLQLYYGGWPIWLDASLPPGAVLFEPVP